MKKRGISAIVATVLIILVTVAAVAIIWLAIVPMISENVSFDSVDVQINVVSSGGYTTYDATTKMLTVQIGRGSDDDVIDEVKIIIRFENGDSTSKVVEAPGANQMKTYEFRLSGGEVPISVAVAPIVIVEAKEKEGAASQFVEFSDGSISENFGANVFDSDDIPTTGLVSWWKFDGDFNDSVGGNDGEKGNLVADSGFESGNLGDWGLVTSGNLSVAVVSDEKRGGSYSVKLTKLKPTSTSDSHYFAIRNYAISDTNGTSYVLGVWVKGNLGDRVKIGIQRSGGAGGSGTSGWYMGSYETFVLDGTWQFINSSITFDTGVNADASGYIRLSLHSITPTLFSAYFDDVILTRIPSWGGTGSELEFNGVDDYVDLSSNQWTSVIKEGVDFTILAWAKPDVISRSSIVGQRYGDSMVLALEDDGKFYLSMDDTRHGGPKSDDVLSVGDWSHVAISYTSSDASNVSNIYFNGQPSGGGLTYDGNGMDRQSGLYVGWQSRSDTQGDAGYFDGSIDEVMIYDRALSVDEITAIYENQKGGKV